MKNETTRLAYLILMGSGCDFYEWCPGRKGKHGEGYKATDIDAELAFAMVRYWPNHEIVSNEPDEEDARVSYQLRRVSETDSHQPSVRFVSLTAKSIDAEIANIENYFKANKPSFDLDGLTLFEMCKLKRSRYLMYLEVEKERAMEAANEKEAQARKASMKFPPEENSDEDRVYITAKHGREFIVYYDKGRMRVKKESSADVVFSKLKNSELRLWSYEECPSHGLSTAPEGFVFATATFGKIGESYSDQEFVYLSTPVAELMEQRELTKTPDPKTPKRTMKTRNDTI